MGILAHSTGDSSPLIWGKFPSANKIMGKHNKAIYFPTHLRIYLGIVFIDENISLKMSVNPILFLLLRLLTKFKKKKRKQLC